MSAVNANMQPTMRRPVPLCMRVDLQTEAMTFRGRPYRAVKDPIALRYHRLREEQYYLLTLLDGRQTLESLQQSLQLTYPHTHWGLTELQSLISDFHEKRLVASQRSGQSAGLGTQRKKARRQRILSGLMSLLFIRFPGVYPEPFLRRAYPWIRWVFHPLTVAFVICSIIAAMSLLMIKFDVVMRQMPEFQQFFGWPNLLYLAMTMAVVKVFHELGHGFTCHHFGAESHSIGLMLLVFSPTLYCDVSDSWMLRSKWQRILIAAAGIYVEIFLSAMALFTWWYTETGLLHHLALNMFFVTTVSTVIFNMNPLMRFDGYYVLSDLLEIPNLQQRASQAVRNAVGWYCFGIEPRPDPFEPERGRWWVIAFAVASATYRCFVMVGIGVFLYTVLKPYRLEVLGIMLSSFSVGMMIGQFVYQVIKMVRAPRSKQLSRGRMTATLCIVGLLLLAVMQIPVPYYIEAAVLIQPHDVKHVYTKTAGVLRQAEVQSGDHVQKEQILATLVNPQLEDQLRQLELDITIETQKRRMAIAERDPARQQLAEKTITTRTDQLQELRQQHARLILRSPIEGTVVSAESQPQPERASDDYALDTWHGDPLEARNTGALIQPNTHLCSIAPDDRLEAVLYIDQSDRNDLQEGQPIRIKFDHLPDQVYSGEISEVSTQAVAYVPASLSSKSDGPLPTVTDQGGRERLTSLAWEAKVVLERHSGLFVSGLRGRARIVTSQRSIGELLQRWLRQTIHFRL